MLPAVWLVVVVPVRVSDQARSSIVLHVVGGVQIVRKILQLGTYLAHTDFLQKDR